MVNYILKVVIIFICLLTACQKQHDGLQKLSKDELKSFTVSEWVGCWAGMLSIDGISGQQEIPMKLDIRSRKNSDTLEWNIIYGKDEEIGLRAYLLIPLDVDNGQFIIDENNGILLDALYSNNRLVSQFEVAENLLTSSYEIRGNEIVFEIVVCKKKDIKITGGIIRGVDTIPEVKTFPVSVTQVARLKKQLPCK